MDGLSPAEYRALVEQAPIMIWRSNAEGKCDYFNDRWLSFTGRTMDEQVGDGWSTGVHPEDLDRCLQTYSGALAARQAFEMEYRLRRGDGEYRWILDCGVPILDADGNLVGFIGSCVDVTERVEAQRALVRAHAAEVRALRDLLPICAWCKRIRDDQGYWNSVEMFLREHAAAHLTHALCPECAVKLEAGDRPD
jgi:PAS domain S-box-containing protein